MAPFSVSVVIPVRNEEDNVLPLVEEIRDSLQGRVPFELIYVDDGSTDATSQRLLEARRRVLPALRIVRHQTSCGQSAAIHSGVRASHHPWVVLLDGDGQNDPRDIPALLALAAGSPLHPDLVCGLRRERRDTLMRRVASRVANAVRGRVLGDRVSDTGCGLKLIRREAFLQLPRFDHMHRFLPALVERDGGGVATLEVSHRPRLRGRSKYGVLDRLREGLLDLLGVAWLQRRGSLPRVEEIGADIALVRPARRHPVPGRQRMAG